jgi:hypothetical protein
MYSISQNEFSELPTFIEKVVSAGAGAGAGTGDGDGAGAGAGAGSVHDLRAWCAERGFLLHFSKTPSGMFYTLKYDRAKLTEEQYNTVGRFRSVVFDSNGRICCVAPSKMLKLTDEMKSLPVNSAGGLLTAEEFVEGIMVNLFWHADKWYIATKSCVGEVSYDHIVEAQAEAVIAENGADDTAGASAGASTGACAGAGASAVYQKLSVHEVLRRRICEVLSLLPGGLDSLPKQHCYSLVVQHPKNQIVNVITVPKLYLVAVYNVTANEAEAGAGAGVNVTRLDRDTFAVLFGGSVSHTPVGLSCVAGAGAGEDDGDGASEVTATFTPHTVEDYCRMYASLETRSVSLPGVVFVDKDTGFCYKKRNPKYESVKKRKGMEQKLMAQYLQLRKDRGIDEYLKYHPQHSRTFRQFRDRVHEYTQRLYDAYIAHYVKKDAKPLKEYDRELKTHMYKLHYDVYLATMKDAGSFVTKNTVINYVNQLASAQQLACLNTTPVAEDAGAGAGADATESLKKQRSFPLRRPIERSGNAESRSGFRNAKPSRGGRMVPSLTVQIPSSESAVNGSDVFAKQHDVKGAKATGTVKVQNQFAGLDVD